MTTTAAILARRRTRLRRPAGAAAGLRSVAGSIIAQVSCNFGACLHARMARSLRRTSRSCTPRRRPERREGSTRSRRSGADHGAAERRVLLGAFADAERHRDHADDHRQRRHQHRADARRTGRGQRPPDRAFIAALPREGDEQDALAVATPMVMIAPVRAGTDSVVPVMKSIQQCRRARPAARR